MSSETEDLANAVQTEYRELLENPRPVIAQLACYLSVAAFASAATVVAGLQRALTAQEPTDIPGMTTPLLSEEAASLFQADASAAVMWLLTVAVISLWGAAILLVDGDSE